MKRKDAFTFIKKYRSKNNDEVILANLNLNSIPNKLSSLKEIIFNNIDVLVIQETQIDETFPKGSFDIPGYKRPYRKDRNIHGGGILVFVREDIPSRQLAEIDIENNIEGLFIVIDLRKSKWPLFATYKLPSLSKVRYFDEIGKGREEVRNGCADGGFQYHLVPPNFQPFSRLSQIRAQFMLLLLINTKVFKI